MNNTTLIVISIVVLTLAGVFTGHDGKLLTTAISTLTLIFGKELGRREERKKIKKVTK